MGAITFDELVARADDETLQDLVGQPVVRLLNLLDPTLARPSALRDILTGLHSPEELLRNPDHRRHLFNLLPSESARHLAARLDLDLSTPYRALAGASVRRNSQSEQLLFNELGVVPARVREREEQVTIEPAQADYGLFAHQRHAARQALAFLERPPRRAVLHMPTGAGKTRTAMNVIATALRRAEPAVVLWLAYSEELCSQAASEFQRAWRALGDREVALYRYWGGNDLSIEEVTDGVVVAGLAKLYERAKRDLDFVSRLGDRSQLVIIDEAHQAIADTYRFVLDYLTERDTTTGLLGLTATPGRTWDDPEKDAELAAFFGRQKVTLRIEGYSSPVEYLIQEGYLAAPDFRALYYAPAHTLTAQQLDELATALDVPRSVLETLAADEQRNLLIVTAVEDLLRRHPRVLVFAASVAHAHVIATVLRARGRDAAAVTAKTSRHERVRVLARYTGNHPDPMVLCNFGVLTAGFDAPRTSAALVARPTKSLVLYSQMIGRALRGPRAGGNETAEILTVVDTTLPGFGDLSDAFHNWEDVWDD